MARDERLDGIEDLYSKISNDNVVKDLIGVYYQKALANSASVINENKRMKVEVPERAMELAGGILPAQAMIDSIPDPFLDPSVKRYDYKKEHAGFYYSYNDLKESINQKMIELDASPIYKSEGSAGTRAMQILETRFNFNKMELSEYRQQMVESSRNAQHAIAQWSIKSDHYAASPEERKSPVAREASAYRISRAILTRMCEELEFQTNLCFFKARKHALGNMAAQAALQYQNRSITRGSALAQEVSEISKGLLAKIKLMLFDGNLLQAKAQLINSSFDNYIQMSRL